MARQKLIHLHGTGELTEVKAQSAGIRLGEIAVRHNEGNSELYVVTDETSGKFDKFINAAVIESNLTDAINSLKNNDIKGLADRIAAFEEGGANSVEGQIESAITVLTGETGQVGMNTAAIGTLNNDLGELSGEFSEYQTTNNAAVAEAKKAGTDAAAALEAYKTEHNTEYATFKETNSQAIATAKQAGDDAAAALEAYKTDNDTRVKAVEDDLSDYKTTNNAAVAEAKQAGTDAAAALETYKTEHDAEYATFKESNTEAIANAKKHATDLNTAMNTRVEALEAIDHDHSNKTVLDGITAEKVAAWDTAESNANDYTDEKIKGVTDVLNPHVVSENLHIQDGERTLWTNAANAFNTFMNEQEIDETVNTLHEIASWMAAAGVDATELAEAIAAEAKTRGEEDVKLQNQINALVGEGEGSVVEQISAAVEALQEEITAAEGAAKKYADEEIGKVNGVIEENERVTAESLTNLDERVEALEAIDHDHSNKTVLDGITAEKVAAWDAAESNAKKHATDLNTAMNTRVEALEAIDHDHSNKTVLDGITAEKVAAWDAAESNAKKYTDEGINALNATVSGQNSYDASTHAGTNLKVEVVQTDGVITAVNITDSGLVIDCGEY